MSRNALAGRSLVAWAGRSSIAFLAVVACLAPTASCALAKAVPRRHTGRLPGFPAIRGVVPALGSPAAVSAHEKLIGEAFAAARAQRARTARGGSEQSQRGTPVPSEESLPCVEESEEELTFLTQNVCYRGGPVLRDPTIHLIFWQGSGAEPHVEPFPSGYEAKVERYFEGIAHDSGLETNVFAVDSQYGEEQGGAFHAGEYKLSFDGATDVNVDTSPFPKGGCTDETSFSEGPCLLDSDIQKEVEKVAGPSPKGLGNVYVVLTPPGVGGCFEAESGECAYRQYCAYHSDFGGDGMTPGDQTLYADLPYLGEVGGCDSGVHPNEETSKTEEKEGRDHGADAVIDTASHELNETITDPIGSQCDEEEVVLGKPEIVGCEKNAWTDAIGQEIADKCLPPESTIFGVYGEPLGELLPGHEASLYNQNIDGRHYWTQRVWSNGAGLLEGGCVQRIIGASFSVSPGIEATVPTTLDGSTSGAPGDPATYWAWSFGEGEQIGTAAAKLSHTFAQPGLYLVGLTAYDAYGNAQATIEEVEVGPAPVPPLPPPPTPTPAPNTIVVKEPIAPVRITAAELATKLGLAPNGKRLAGTGPFALGHAECPPACGVTLQLYAKVASAVHKHRSTKLVLVGSAHMTFAAGGSGALSLSLNTKGAALLRKRHMLAGKLVASVEGQEGGAWQLVRRLTLTDSDSAARRHG